MRIAFQVNTISRFQGNIGIRKARHFFLIPAKLTSMSSEEDSQEFAKCAQEAEQTALMIEKGEYPEWSSSVEEIRWQILP